MKYRQRQFVNRARRFATEAHKGQTRDDNGTPYIVHPAQVAAILSQVTDDPNVIAAGWLHDVIEDCGVTWHDLAVEFNIKVANLVKEVTNNGEGNAFPNLHSRDGVLIKFADRTSNLSDMNGWDDKKVAWYLGKSKFWKSE